MNTLFRQCDQVRPGVGAVTPLQALRVRAWVLAISLPMALIPCAHAQSIYTCVDKRGHKTFQNAPCPVGTRVERQRDYDDVPIDPRLAAQTRQAQAEVDARNRAAGQGDGAVQVVVVPRGQDARDRQRNECAEAKAYRERELQRVGLRRTYDLLSRLDRRVFDACKGL